MSIIPATHTPINLDPTRRPFGVGLFDPEPAPAPIVAEVLGDDWRSTIGNALRKLGYKSAVIGAVLIALRLHGTASACDDVAPEVAVAIDQLYGKFASAAPLVAPAPAPIVQPVYFETFEPDSADRLWWFQQCDAADRARLNPDGIRKPSWR